MVEAKALYPRVEDEEAGGPQHVPELPFPSALPPALRQDWPAPRRAVIGDRGGVLAQLQYALARGCLVSLSRLPLGARNALVGAFSRVAKLVDRRRSECARVFLRQALGQDLDPAELERRVLQAWRHLFDVTLDAEAFHRNVPQDRIREHYEIQVSDDVRRLMGSGTGTILATLHEGDWEAGSAILPWIGFDPFYAVAKPPRNLPLSLHTQRVRERRGVRVLPRRGAMKDAAAVIRGGGTLGLLLDQRARKRPVMAPFFGRLARCDRSAAVLLKKLRAPVVIGACYRTTTPWRWRVELPVVIQPSEIEGRSVEEITTRINQEFERLILAAPEQYFWLHDRYRGA